MLRFVRIYEAATLTEYCVSVLEHSPKAIIFPGLRQNLSIIINNLLAYIKMQTTHIKYDNYVNL